MNLKKIIKIFFLLLVLISLAFWIYQNPKTIFETETQEKILETIDKIETEIDWDTNWKIDTSTWDLILKELENSKSFNEQNVENLAILNWQIQNLIN